MRRRRITQRNNYTSILIFVFCCSGVVSRFCWCLYISDVVVCCLDSLSSSVLLFFRFILHVFLSHYVFNYLVYYFKFVVSTCVVCFGF